MILIFLYFFRTGLDKAIQLRNDRKSSAQSKIRIAEFVFEKSIPKAETFGSESTKIVISYPISTPTHGSNLNIELIHKFL